MAVFEFVACCFSKFQQLSLKEASMFTQFFQQGTLLDCKRLPGSSDLRDAFLKLDDLKWTSIEAKGICQIIVGEACS